MPIQQSEQARFEPSKQDPIYEQLQQEHIAREYKLLMQISDMQKERDGLRLRLEEARKIMARCRMGTMWNTTEEDMDQLAAALAAGEGK